LELKSENSEEYILGENLSTEEKQVRDLKKELRR
jgi:hypothetical protein